MFIVFFFQLSVTSKLKYTARDKVIDHLTYSTSLYKGVHFASPQ